jgi:hypothetical protein
MSRSRKKIPIIGITTATSEKQNKRLANRRFRRVTKIELKISKEFITPYKVLSNVWCYDKDGKRYVRNLAEKDLRK